MVYIGGCVSSSSSKAEDSRELSPLQLGTMTWEAPMGHKGTLLTGHAAVTMGRSRLLCFGCVILPAGPTAA